MSTPPSAPQFSPPPSAPYTPQTQPKNGFGIAALVLGIVGIVLGLIPAVGIVLAILLGLIGIVFGILGFLRANKGIATNKVMAIVGTVLSVLAIVVGIISLILSIAFVSSVNDAIEESQNDPVTGSTAPASDQAAPSEAADQGQFPGQMEKDVVGEAGTELTVGDVAITAGPLTPASDDLGQYYCTDITATNNGSETLTSFGTFSFKVQNPSGSATDSTFSTIDGQLQSSDLAPGGQTSGKVCFDADQVAPGQNVVLYEEIISFDDARGAWINTIG